MSTSSLRVLVVEDSPTARALLVSMLESDPAITVVGEAADGIEAVALTHQLRPDVITMDVHMPNMDGLHATREIMSSVPTPILVVTANARPGDVELSLDVTAAGALMLLEKPVAPQSPAFPEQRQRLVSMVKAMAQVKVVRRWSSGHMRRVTPSNVERMTGEMPSARSRIVAIGASTGGPAAVQRLLRALPPTFRAPVLLVQHIADGFTPGLVHWLGQTCPLTVKVAKHRELLRAGTVYVAPDKKHLGVVDDRRVLIADDDAIQGFRPSATFLYGSVARAFGASTAAVILTGMGSDGVDGLRTVRMHGGTVLAQDEASSVVFGMPREAIRAGLADYVGPVDELAKHLQHLAATEKQHD
jgi:two-component system, chemotaxis family, protein-glutamate methylesterase/glutaminase